MSITTRLLARLYRLPPAETYDIAVEKGLKTAMLDGVVLRGDRYYPRRKPVAPTMLIRTPYGRKQQRFLGLLFSERGFQAVVQSCRGSDDSGGELSAFRGERDDGIATLRWLQEQPWFDGRLVMAGPSYLGFTQWAIARDAGPVLKALSTQVTSSEFRSVMYPGETFNLDLFLGWIQVALIASTGSMLGNVQTMFTAGQRRRLACAHLPLSEADRIAAGKSTHFLAGLAGARRAR